MGFGRVVWCFSEACSQAVVVSLASELQESAGNVVEWVGLFRCGFCAWQGACDQHHLVLLRKYQKKTEGVKTIDRIRLWTFGYHFGMRGLRAWYIWKGMLRHVHPG